MTWLFEGTDTVFLKETICILFIPLFNCDELPDQLSNTALLIIDVDYLPPSCTCVCVCVYFKTIRDHDGNKSWTLMLSLTMSHRCADCF